MSVVACLPPGQKSDFNLIVTLSPMGVYELKLSDFGCHFGCHFSELVLRSLLNLRVDEMGLTIDFNLSYREEVEDRVMWSCRKGDK